MKTYQLETNYNIKRLFS